MAEQILDVIGAGLLVAGTFFCLAAAIGLVRFPDSLSRMHAATKPSVFGMILVLAGVALSLRDPKVITMMAVALLLQIMTAPVSGHLVSRASWRSSQWDARHAVVDDLADDQREDDQAG